MDFNRDELRRELRAIDRLQRAAATDQRSLVRAVFEDLPGDERPGALLSGMDRRGFFRLGGFAVAATAVLAACGGGDGSTPIGISGESATFEPLEDKVVDNVVLLRTAGSLEWSLVDAYRKILDNGFVVDPDMVRLLTVFQEHHMIHAETMAAVTTEAGGAACTLLNTKLTNDLFDPIITLIAVSGDDRSNQSLDFAHAVESWAGSSYQSFVPAFSEPSLRRTAMSIGSIEAQHAAVLAAIINPTQLVGSGGTSESTATATAPTTTVVAGLPTTAPVATTTTTLPPASAANVTIAVPSTFGSLAPVPLTIGPSVTGVAQRTINLETPSLNSYIYEDEAC